jgi:hypothetical protein
MALVYEFYNRRRDGRSVPAMPTQTMTVGDILVDNEELENVTDFHTCWG